MRPSVGIHESVYISKAAINEKKKLEISLMKVGETAPEAAKPKSVFDQSLTAGVVSEGSTGGLMFMVPLLPTDKAGAEKKTQEAKIKMITDDFTRLKNQLTSILMVYMLEKDIDLSSIEVQYANTGIVDGTTYEARILTDQDILNRIYDNLVNRFVKLGSPFFGKPEYPVRFKLVRQSKDKHYAKIPDRYIADNPFIESMDIPKEQSKVIWTSYELKEGLDKDTPVAASTAEAKSHGTAAGSANVIESNPFAPQ